MSNENAVEELVHFYETLTPATLADGLRRVYAPDARFKDPFNDVQGLEAIGRVFEHMFEQVSHPRFQVTRRMVHGSEAFLIWDLIARPYSIHGASHIVFDAAGKVSCHRDYWDAAGEVYEKVPVLGVLMRWLKSRLATE